LKKVSVERVKLQVRPREGRGSKDAKALRAAGEIPGVIYSATTETQAITVNARALRQAVSHHGLHTILDVTLDGDGKPRPVLIKDLQLDPVRGRVVHIDLHEIRLDQVIQTVIPVHLEGHAEGVNMGGALNQPVHEVHVDALPADLIDFISVDVSALEIGQSIRLADIEAPSGITFTDDAEGTVLATIAAPVSEEELKTEAELEAEAEAEAEAAALAEAQGEEGEGAEPGEGGEEAGGEEPSGDESSE
jgi:large subunit ribosomal protein L25